MLRFTLYVRFWAEGLPLARGLWCRLHCHGHGLDGRLLIFHVAKLRITQLTTVTKIAGKNTIFTEMG